LGVALLAAAALCFLLPKSKRFVPDNFAKP